MLDYLDKLEGLSEEEKKIALEILEQYQTTGHSDIYNDIIYEDYSEIPVDVITFIKDDRYLGKAWHSADGKCKLYPYWEKRLLELFPDNVSTDRNNAIFSGARGLGKSEVAVTVGLYMLYRVMCLKNPHEFFNLKPTEKIAFAFMNITKILAEEIGIAKFQSTVQMSPWFMERGTLTGTSTIVWNPPDYINIIIGSQASHVIGQPIFFAFFDEISFIKNKDVEKQKEIAIDMIDTAIGGMKTRFLHKGNNPTLLVLASSKRSEKSFLEEHMKKKLSDEGESKNTLIVDEPVWNIKPAETYCGKKFYVGVGNKFLSSEIIPDDDNISEWKNKGYQILEVPVEFRSEFLDNIDRALCDFAGISSSELTKYISGQRFMAIKRKEIENPFSKEIIEVGNAPDDTQQYSDFFDLTKVDPKYKYKPLYIHLDMSLSGDRTGIVGTWIIGKKPSIENGPRELIYQYAFGVAIKAPKGWQVSFEKNRNFIYWLKEKGFNIKGITTDTYQNAALGQDLIAKGYNYEVLSVDRVNQEHICEPYAFFKNCIYEQRVRIPYKCDLLTEEVTNLERNGTTGKIDHPDFGRAGSKDLSDAFCGSLYSASKHAEEYAYEYGDDLDNFLDANSEDDLYNYRQQIIMDFENELSKLVTSEDVRSNLSSISSYSMDLDGVSSNMDSSYFIKEGIFL